MRCQLPSTYPPQRALGLGRMAAYELVRSGAWPTPVLRLGRLIKVPRAPLLALLGLTDEPRLSR